MPTRRALLRTGGTAALAALAGCQSSAPTALETTDPTSAGAGEVRLDAESVAPGDVPDDSTVGLATTDLRELVADAASSDGRVDLQTSGPADSDETLALGEFEYLQFAGETYEATASFARFAEEASHQYDLVAVDDGEVDGDADVTVYESLTDAERVAVDRMLENGSITVGHHETGVPDGAGGVVAHDYVRVDDETYETRATVGDHAAHHMLTLDPAEPDAGAQVVTVPDREPEVGWGELLADALDPGTVGVEDRTNGESLVEYLRGVDYVATATSVLDVSVTETVQ